MHLSVEEFTSDLLMDPPSAVAVLQWEEHAALTRFSEQFSDILDDPGQAVTLLKVSAKKFDSRRLLKKLLDAADSPEASKSCLLITDIEAMAPVAARVLNDLREYLGRFRATVITIQGDQYHDFVVECPDLMSWVGIFTEYMEDLVPVSLTKEDLDISIRKFEEHYQMDSAKFLEQYDAGMLNMHDAWFWKELLAIQSDWEANS